MSIKTKSITLPSGIVFELDSFNKIDFQFPKTKQDYRYSLKIKNVFIKDNIISSIGLDRIFLAVYVNINRNMTQERKSFITVGDILSQCNYKLNRCKPLVFYHVLRSIYFLIDSEFIELEDPDFDFKTVSYKTVIHMKVINNSFMDLDDYTILYYDDYDNIMSRKSNVKKESLLAVYLFVCSNIVRRRRDMLEEEFKDSPSAFWKSLDTTARSLGMSKTTVTECLDILCSEENGHEPLLIMRNLGSIIKKNPDTKKKVINKTPNIYVLNQPGYEKEFEYAKSYLSKTFKTLTFYTTNINTKETEEFYDLPDKEFIELLDNL